MHIFSLMIFGALAVAGPKWDSVAVFYRPDKVAIQINEAGARGRLQTWMNALGAGEQVILVSRDGSFKMDCARTVSAVNCGLSLHPSEQVVLADRKVSAKVSLAELGLNPASEFYQIGFENSNGDHVELRTEGGEFILSAGKKSL